MRSNVKQKKIDFRNIFSMSIVWILRILVLLLLIISIIKTNNYIRYTYDKTNLMIIILYLFLTAGIFIAINKNIKIRYILYAVLIVGIGLRVIWSFSVDNIPVSDFNQAYEAALRVVDGDYSAMMGTSYFGRFPHYIVFILYMSKIIVLFGENSLLIMKIINIIFSSSTIVLIYLILKEIFKDDYKKIVIGTFISAVMPASILYTPVYCTENLAIPFYLASIYVFILVMNNKRSDKWLIISALLLLIGHLFRMVGQIVIIAYVMYIIIYKGERYEKKV